MAVIVAFTSCCIYILESLLILLQNGHAHALLRVSYTSALELHLLNTAHTYRFSTLFCIVHVYA